MPEIIKVLVLIVCAGVTVGAVLASCLARPASIRIWLALLVLATVADPIATLDFHHGERHNVRGWEICWPELIAMGLIAVRLVNGGLPLAWCRVLTGLWLVHLAVLVISTTNGINGQFSGFYLFRQVRQLVVLAAILAVVSRRSDWHALLIGLALSLLWNEWEVLNQKYRFGRHQCPGLFDHQNAMAMYVGLVLPILFAVCLTGAIRGLGAWLLALGVLAGSHSLIASLSRASLLVSALTMSGVFMLAWLGPWTRRKFAISGMLVAAVLIGLVVVAPTILARFSDDRANHASHRTREVMNQAAAVMSNDHRWLGVGPNNFAEAINWPRYGQMIDVSQREKGHKVDLSYKRGIVESHYWQLQSETGLLGLGSWCLILAYTLIMAVGKVVANRDELPRMLAAGIGLGCAGNYLQSTIEHTLINSNNGALWLLLSGWLVVLPWRSSRTANEAINVVDQDETNEPPPALACPVPCLDTPAHTGQFWGAEVHDDAAQCTGYWSA